MGRIFSSLVTLACLGILAASSAAASTAVLSQAAAIARRQLNEVDATDDRSSSQGSEGDGSMSKPKKYKLDVTVADGTPDCVKRKVIHVNGQFTPRLMFTQGDWVEVSIRSLMHPYPITCLMPSCSTLTSVQSSQSLLALCDASLCTCYHVYLQCVCAGNCDQ